MGSTRWDPWSEFVSLREAMNNLLEESFVSRPRPGEEEGAGERRDDAANRDPDGRWVLRERRFGAFERSVTLPSAVKAESATADFRDGVLTIVLPKADEAKPRAIPVRPGIGNVLPNASGELEGQFQPATTDLTPQHGGASGGETGATGPANSSTSGGSGA